MNVLSKYLIALAGRHGMRCISTADTTYCNIPGSEHTGFAPPFSRLLDLMHGHIHIMVASPQGKTLTEVEVPMDVTKCRRLAGILKVFLVAACIMAAALAGIPKSALAVEDAGQAQYPESSDNMWLNEYSWDWYHPVTSHLEAAGDGGYDRVEWISDALHAEHYDSGFSFVSGKTIAASTYTPTGAADVLWGGYYKGSQYRFVVTGQANPNQSDSVAVIRVTKYSIDWEYLGNVEFSGINVYKPFDGGSVRMAESAGELWIHTCRTMYGEAEYRHQANLTLRIRESDMAKLDCGDEIGGVAYSSHSFNQYIVAAGGKIYAADHGDAIPRMIFATAITPSADGGPGTTGTAYPIVSFKGRPGVNFTGATFDGFETADNGATLVAAGTITDQDRAFGSSGSAKGSYNVWVGVVSTADGKATVKNVTSNAYDGPATVGEPVLVKMSEDRFLLMWTTEKKTGYFERHGQIQYVLMDSAGNLIGDISSLDGTLSDCQPIAVGDSVVWYTTGIWRKSGWKINSDEGLVDAMERIDSGPFFYSLNTSTGKLTAHKPEVPMYRLYNQWSGEHLFTASKEEYNNLASIGWTQEGVAWLSPAKSASPVYRLYNPYSGDHFYTGSESEYSHLGSIGWNKEGIAFYSADSSSGKPIYRLFNRWLTQGTHLFTTSADEYRNLGSIGWNEEGVAFYGL